MKTWSNIVESQPLAGRILKNSIKQGRLSHAYLISGSQGTGKRAIALQMAKTILCPNKSGIEPCSDCVICHRVDENNYPDVFWVEPEEKGSIGKEQVDELYKEFSYSSLESKDKIYIITHADRLTVNAANRILKFLEEPNNRATALILTENLQSIIPTVRSRCQLIELAPLSFNRFKEELVSEGIQEADAVFLYAITKDVSEAKLLLEDSWFAESRKLMVQLIEVYLDRPEDAYLFIHQNWLKHFTKRNEHLRGLDLLLLAFKDFLYFYVGSKESMVIFHQGDRRLEKAMMSFSEEDLVHILESILDAQRKINANVNPSLVMEQLTFKIKR